MGAESWIYSSIVFCIMRQALEDFAQRSSKVRMNQSCRELALSLSHENPAISVSHVTVWRYQGLLACNGPRGRQRHVPGHGKPDTDWVTGPFS
jgi:hypothetical protein